MFCPKCGRHIWGEAHFCPHCGTALVKAVPAAPATEPAHQERPAVPLVERGRLEQPETPLVEHSGLQWPGVPSTARSPREQPGAAGRPQGVAAPAARQAPPAGRRKALFGWPPLGRSRWFRVVAFLLCAAALILAVASLLGAFGQHPLQLTLSGGEPAATPTMQPTALASPTVYEELPTVPAAEGTPSTTSTAPPSPDTPSPTDLPPTSEPPTSTPPPATAAPLVHTIQAGETLLAIARQYGLTVDALAQANNIQPTDLLRIGQQLVIPGQALPSTPAAAAPAGPGAYVVQSGDTLQTIAQRYNVSLADLLAANNLQSADQLQVGQQITIPGPTVTPVPTQAVTPTAAPSPTPTGSAAAPGPSPAAQTDLQFPAPNLLTPKDGAQIQGAQDVLLNWSSVGLLSDDTWYVVHVWSDDPAQPTLPDGWTRTTAWRLPATLRPGANAASHRFHWTVTVMRSSEGQQPVALSPTSTPRTFEWD